MPKKLWKSLWKIVSGNRKITKFNLLILAKLESKVNSELVDLYDGLHPKHLFFTRHDWVAGFINKDDVVLDIASGSGCCAYNLSQKCCKVIAVDLQKPLGQFTDGIPNLEFHQGDILEIVPDVKEKYTFAVAFHILEHLDNPVDFLKKVKCDKIAVIVPHEENWLVAVKKDLKLNWKGDSTHRRLYTKELLRAHLQEAEYKNIEVLEFDGDNGIRAMASKQT